MKMVPEMLKLTGVGGNDAVEAKLVQIPDRILCLLLEYTSIRWRCYTWALF